MKKINELFETDLDILIKDIKINSKEVEPGDLFVCIKGVKVDRHDFIDEAIKNGASCLIVEHDVDVKIPYIKVENVNKILPKLCQDFYDFNSLNLKIIGITGTDGKTTTATSIQYLIGLDKCGYIGTNGCTCKYFSENSFNSTPDPTVIYKMFKKFKEAGCEYVVMEASSEGFFRGRLDNLLFDSAGYTNITWEHINVHGSFENYVSSKTRLASQTKNKFIINLDDEFHEEFMKKNNNYLTYGTNSESDLYIKNYCIYPTYTKITFIYEEKEYIFTSPLLGKFNVYNLACAFLVCLQLGFDIHDLIENTINIDVSGRLEMIELGQDFKIMVDYAHTTNAVKSILEFAKILKLNKKIVVIGSAGERDFKKRPLMGEVVLKNADYTIFTSDDPRSEDPYEIAMQMVGKNKDNNKYEIIVDRSLAIKRAIELANKNDIVLVLGKGNETSQKLKNGAIHYNDTEEIKKWITSKIEK